MKTRAFRRMACCLSLAFGLMVPAAGSAGQSGPKDGSFLVAQTYSAETPEYCRKQYQDCLAKCAANPDNQKDANAMTQCRAYCESVHSGCGK